MSESSNGLFHCGRCGHFFKARTGAGVIRRCPECGGDPALALDDRRVRKMNAEGEVVRGISPNPETSDVETTPHQHGRHGGRHSHRSHRNANPAMRRLVIFVALWSIVLGVFAVAVVIRNNRKAREEAERAERYKTEREEQTGPFSQNLNAMDREFIRKGYPKCQEALFGVLQNLSPESRSHWVCDPLDTIEKMTRFSGTFFSCKPDELPEQEYFGILSTPKGRMIESLWKTPDGNRRIEAVFQHTPEGWRLDWEEFVRYSDTQWGLFLIGNGNPTGEFRLLARQRFAEERKNRPTLSIVFHRPYFGKPDDAGPASPVFEVLRTSPPGRKLEALFKLKESGKAPFDARIPSLDPNEMIRVRVRIRRIDPGDGSHTVRKFTLEDVLAGHWLRIDDSGIPQADDSGFSMDDEPVEEQPEKSGDSTQ